MLVQYVSNMKITYILLLTLATIVSVGFLVPQASADDAKGVMKSSGPVVITLESPLKQFKSGTASIDVLRNDGFLLTFKANDGHPACVKPDTKIQLLKIGWAKPGPKDFGYNPGRGPLAFQDPQSNNTNFHGLPTSSDIIVSYNGTQLSDNTVFQVKQGQNMTLMLDVASNPENAPVILYTAPHSGFTKTNGIDFKLSNTMVITPAKVMLYMSVSKDATPSTYGATIKGNSETYLFFVTVK